MQPELTRTQLLDKMKSHLKDIERLSKLDDPTEDDEYSEPLSIEKEVTIRVLLSWGGPADGFKLHFKDKELQYVEYFFQDWGTNQEIQLNDDEAQMVFDFYLFGEYPDYLDEKEVQI